MIKKIKIEISKGSNIKYEYDEKSNELVIDRVLHNSNVYPYNYGYIPNTLAPDNDPVDIIIISDYSFIPGCYAECKIIGGIETEDEKGIDDKIIGILNNNLDPKSKLINDINDISKYELDKIIYFLIHYKDGEENKFIKVENIYNREEAINRVTKYSL